MKDALKQGLIGALGGFLMSFPLKAHSPQGWSSRVSGKARAALRRARTALAVGSGGVMQQGRPE